MVDSSDFHAARPLDVYLGPHRNFLAGGNLLASPTIDFANSQRDLCHSFIAYVQRGLCSSLPEIYDGLSGVTRRPLACFREHYCLKVFLGFLSIIYDFHKCFYPSREYPYFTSGRLMLGALIPFLLLFVFGLDHVLSGFGNAGKFLVLAAIILFMLISEIITDWLVFSSQYNWFHM